MVTVLREVLAGPRDGETVISQLAERYGAKKVWAKDRWHLTSRWLRKFLRHTAAVYFCEQVGLPPLCFADLLTD